MWQCWFERMKQVNAIQSSVLPFPFHKSINILHESWCCYKILCKTLTGKQNTTYINTSVNFEMNCNTPGLCGLSSFSIRGKTWANKSSITPPFVFVKVPGNWDVMYWGVRGIDFTLFNDCFNASWNCLLKYCGVFVSHLYRQIRRYIIYFRCGLYWDTRSCVRTFT